MSHRARVAVLTVGLALAAGVADAAILVTTSVNATELANALLSGGSGITINSATLTGAAGAAGLFTGGADSLGFDQGLVLTTGNATFIAGPNNSTAAGANNGAPGDAALTAIVGRPTFNATVLEINFTPTGNTLQFSYVFGSEEYNEYVGSDFNDVFAFFVNGVNLARVPGTNTPVTINNVNCGSNSAFYRNNTGGGPAGCPNLGLNTQLDGLTTVLGFTASVNPNTPNLLRLAIADTNDSILDSAVMLQGGTLQSCGGPGQPACGTPPDTAPVPEPGTMMLLGSGVAAAVAARRRRR
jgi:hypothetical protein